MSKLRIAAIGGIAAGLLGLGLAAPAMASTSGANPSPSDTPTCQPTGDNGPTGGAPTISPNFGINPCPSPPPKNPCPLVLFPIPQPAAAGADLSRCRVQQQEFDVADTGFLIRPGVFVQRGTVLGTGPIRFDLGRDVTLSSTLDRFSDFFGDSVLIHHGPLDGVTIDLRTCSIQVSQQDVPWWIRGGGTGLYRRAVAAGLADVQGIVSFPTRNFTCTLPVGLTVAQATADLNNNGVGLPTPLMEDFGVQLTGWSTLNLRHFPPPFVAPVSPSA